MMTFAPLRAEATRFLATGVVGGERISSFSFLFFRTVIPTRRILGGDFLFFLKSKKSDRSFKNLSSISSIENVRIFGFDNYIWYDVYVVIVV